MTQRPIQGGPAIPVVFGGVDPNAPGGGGGGTPGTPGFPAGGMPTYTAPAPIATSTGITSGAGRALAPNPRRDFWIQNCGTNPLFVYLGASGNTTTLVSYILKGCTVANDGSGGFVTDDEWKGEVSVNGTTPQFIAGQHL